MEEKLITSLPAIYIQLLSTLLHSTVLHALQDIVLPSTLWCQVMTISMRDIYKESPSCCCIKPFLIKWDIWLKYNSALCPVGINYNFKASSIDGSRPMPWTQAGSHPPLELKGGAGGGIWNSVLWSCFINPCSYHITFSIYANIWALTLTQQPDKKKACCAIKIR